MSEQRNGAYKGVSTDKFCPVNTSRGQSIDHRVEDTNYIAHLKTPAVMAPQTELCTVIC